MRQQWITENIVVEKTGNTFSVKNLSSSETFATTNPETVIKYLRRHVPEGKVPLGDMLQRFLKRLGVPACVACEMRAIEMNHLLGTRKRG